MLGQTKSAHLIEDHGRGSRSDNSLEGCRFFVTQRPGLKSLQQGAPALGRKHQKIFFRLNGPEDGGEDHFRVFGPPFGRNHHTMTLIDSIGELALKDWHIGVSIRHWCIFYLPDPASLYRFLPANPDDYRFLPKRSIGKWTLGKKVIHRLFTASREPLGATEQDGFRSVSMRPHIRMR